MIFNRPITLLRLVEVWEIIFSNCSWCILFVIQLKIRLHPLTQSLSSQPPSPCPWVAWWDRQLVKRAKHRRKTCSNHLDLVLNSHLKQMVTYLSLAPQSIRNLFCLLHDFLLELFHFLSKPSSLRIASASVRHNTIETQLVSMFVPALANGCFQQEYSLTQLPVLSLCWKVEFQGRSWLTFHH